MWTVAELAPDGALVVTDRRQRGLPRAGGSALRASLGARLDGSQSPPLGAVRPLPGGSGRREGCPAHRTGRARLDPVADASPASVARHNRLAISFAPKLLPHPPSSTFSSAHDELRFIVLGGGGGSARGETQVRLSVPSVKKHATAANGDSRSRPVEERQQRSGAHRGDNRPQPGPPASATSGVKAGRPSDSHRMSAHFDEPAREGTNDGRHSGLAGAQAGTAVKAPPRRKRPRHGQGVGEE